MTPREPKRTDKSALPQCVCVCVCIVARGEDACSVGRQWDYGRDGIAWTRPELRRGISDVYAVG